MNTQAEKQNFIGGLVTSVLVKKGVEFAIEKGLEKAAKRQDTDITKADVPKTAPVVINELKKEVQAQAEHQLDAEPHWQSRNLWGSFVGVITALETIRTFWMDDHPQTLQEWAIPVGIIVAAVTPLYSRFIAKKPLFR